MLGARGLGCKHLIALCTRVNPEEVICVPPFTWEAAMTEPVGPAIARQRLYTYLRERRESLGHPAATVARKMRWSPSKLNRIENGVVTIQPIEVKALLEFY